MKTPSSFIRFVLEIAFLLVVAAAAGIAGLSWPGVVLIMAIAWLLTVLVEWTASRDSTGLRSGKLAFLFRGPAVAEGVAEEVPAPAPEPAAAQTAADRVPGRPWWQGWPSRPDLQDEERKPIISHVHVLPPDAEEDAAEAMPTSGEGLQAEPTPAEERPEELAPVTVDSAPGAGSESPAPPEEEAASPVSVAPEAIQPVREPAPEPEPQPAPTPAFAAAPAFPARSAPDSVVPFFPRANGPREWNLWDLERRAREREGADAIQDEEWALLFMHLRQFASADGVLPPNFDDLVRESFGDLIGTGA